MSVHLTSPHYVFYKPLQYLIFQELQFCVLFFHSSNSGMLQNAISSLFLEAYNELIQVNCGTRGRCRPMNSYSPYHLVNPYLYDGSNKFLQEIVSQKRRPVVMDEVNQQTFDMRSILILLCFFKKSHFNQGHDGSVCCQSNKR